DPRHRPRRSGRTQPHRCRSRALRPGRSGRGDARDGGLRHGIERARRAGCCRRKAVNPFGHEVIRLGTRGSRLAMRQADEVMKRLAEANPGVEIQRVILKTVGDKILDTPLSKIGDKGLFTKELDIALHREKIDLAVHSLKDLPTQLPDDLLIGAVLEREAPNDALISASRKRLADLPEGARVGTSSLRRRSQLLALRRDLNIVDLRGNVPTRLERAE